MAADGDALWVPPVVLVIEVMTVWCSALGDRFMRGERGRGQWAGSFIAFSRQYRGQQQGNSAGGDSGSERIWRGDVAGPAVSPRTAVSWEAPLKTVVVAN